MPRKPDQDKIELAKALDATGKSQGQIAQQLGVSRRTIARWLAVEDPPEIAPALMERRVERALAFADKAWDKIEEIDEWIGRMLSGDDCPFKDLREAATVLGIYIDKVSVLEHRRGDGGRTAIQINILPPTNGTGAVRVNANPVPIHDESGEICGDDSGGRVGKDLYRLPPGRDIVPGESGSAGDDSSEYVS